MNLKNAEIGDPETGDPDVAAPTDDAAANALPTDGATNNGATEPVSKAADAAAGYRLWGRLKLLQVSFSPVARHLTRRPSGRRGSG